MMFWGYGLFLQKKPGLALISTTLHEFHRSSEKAINKTLASVLTHFSLPQDELFMTELLGSYESTLMTSLELKCGALNLLCKALL